MGGTGGFNLSEYSVTSLIREQNAARSAKFEALQRVLEEPARRFVRRLIGLHHAEDDILQDVFLALYLNLDRLQADHIRPFVFRVIRNRSYDILRKQGRYDTVGFDGGLEHTLAVEDVPHEESAHWSLIQVEVQTAIEKLPELQRQAMILYAVENLSYAEVAAAMGTNVGTIKSRIFHARKMLKRLLRPQTLTALGLESPDPDLKRSIQKEKSNV